MIRKNNDLITSKATKYFHIWMFFSVQLLSLLLVFLFVGCQNSNSSKYGVGEAESPTNDSREKLITNDNVLSFDAAIILSQEELKLEQKLFDLRHHYESIIQRNNLPFYNEPFHNIKSFIDTTILYKIFKSMPKGGLLHSHSGGITDINWVISKAKVMPECYVFTNPDSDNYLYGQLGIFKKGTAPLGFISLKEKIKTDPTLNSFYTIY